MRIHRRFAALPPDARGACVAIGNFDGLHLGHRAVLRAAGAAAHALQAPLGVVTFEPHPREVLQPDTAPLRLASLRRKLSLLEGLGVERCYILPFGPALMRLSAEAFVVEVLVGRLGVRAAAAGTTFRFGHRRGGDMALMASLGARHGMRVDAVPPVEVGGELVSSTRIRALVAAGDMPGAAALLGAPFAVEGIVRTGDRRGRELGFPTANLTAFGRRALLPPRGIYAVEAGVRGLQGTERHAAVASLGTNPTFDGHDLRLEVHLLDGRHELYGRRLEVAFLARLREEQRFASIEALVQQMHADCAAARRIHADRADRAPAVPTIVAA